MAVEHRNGSVYDPVQEYMHIFSRLTVIVRNERPTLLDSLPHQENMVNLANAVNMGEHVEQAQRLVTYLAEKVGLKTFPSDAYMTDASDLSSAVHFNASHTG